MCIRRVGCLLFTLKTLSILCAFNTMYRFNVFSQLFIKTFQSFIVLTFALFIIITSNVAAQILEEDYPEVTSMEPDMKYYPSGAFIRLKCFYNCNYKNIITRWEFMACGSDVPNKRLCINSEKNKWSLISDNNKSEYCYSMYIIKKANINHSGLYRCILIFPYSQYEHIIKIYQLQIVERVHSRTGLKPKLIDIQPVNMTIMENSKIVIQCKVYSDYVPPVIWWLKKLDFPMDDTNFSIQYNNKTYINLKTSQKELDNHTYISKLIIEKSNKSDSGMYTCFAVNVYGSNGKDVYIDVISLNQEWNSSTSLLLLFLIPLGFALIPLSVWLCVFFYQKKKLRKLSTDNIISFDFYKYQPVLNRFQLSNTNRIPNTGRTT